MNKLLLVLLSAMTIVAHAETLTGAGATFPAPVYSKWASAYNAATGNQINYAAIGSGGGIKQIDAKTVDFGATDDPRKPEQISEKGQFQFPTVIGGVVPVINVKGIDSLVLDGKTLADIFEGKITNWNDKSIANLNPNVALPDLKITLIVRADSSGTSAVFTDFLSKVSDTFKTNIGVSKTPKWGGNSAAGKGNAGVAGFIKQLPGSIGYVEYAYVKQGNLNPISMKNASGKTVHANADSFAEAAANANWSVPGMAVNLNNQATGWPITAATFILVYTEGNPNTQNVLKFFDWAFTNGDKLAAELEYVALPASVKASIRASWAKNIK
jgi:phosphate transport system substrate-binding protein